MADERGQSEFNMAVSYLNRLNAEFYAVAEARLTFDAHGWFTALTVIEGELSTEMNEKELANFSTWEDKINGMLAKNTQTNTRTGRQEIDQALYKELRSFEIELRKVLKAAGLQNRMLKGGEEFFK
jgi:hypothetical protein